VPSRSKHPSKYVRHAYRPGAELNAVGGLMRRIRKAHGWTQDNLAGQCARRGWDIDHLLVAKIETGVRAVSDLELKLLCEVLGVFPDELLGFRPPPVRLFRK
jgi:transcriptional regulator with XRE-family HTH domain